MIKSVFAVKFLIIQTLMLCLLVPGADCQNSYEQGKIVIKFQQDVPEESAVKLIKQLNLEIIGKYYFEPPSIYFNVEDNVDTFIKELKKEPIVSSVTKGERLKQNDREGTVVRVKFKKGADLKQIE